MFEVCPISIYALLGVVPACLIPFFGSTYKAFLLCFFPLHLLAFLLLKWYWDLIDLLPDPADLFKSAFSGFPWITFVSLKDIFGRDD